MSDRTARLNLRAGSMGRAVGAAALRDLLVGALPEVEIVETGSDGAAWALPVLARARTNGDHAPAAPITVPITMATAVATARALLAGQGDHTELRAYLAAQTRRVLARCGEIDPASLPEARAAGAYEALEIVRAAPPEEVVKTVEASGLRGRGGAYFPVARKWMSAREAAARRGEPPLLVVNAEEGEPGVFKDRQIMEGDPHRLLEGIAIAAHAIGVAEVYLYINGRARLSEARMAQAVRDAEARGFVGEPAGLRVEIRRGAGGYVCGEETVLLESIEGRRAVPRLRPPFPTESGLWGRPTVINNVETLANLPDLFRFGVEWFRSVGTAEAPGTKLIAVSGAVRRPGLIEAPMGTPVAEILRIAGVDTAIGVVMGGPSGGLLPRAKFDRPIGPGYLDPAGAVLGSGGIVAFDDRFPAAEVVRELAQYNGQESCGKCTPCREGAPRLAEALERLRAGDQSARRDIEELVTVMRLGSICGLGQMAPGPVTSALQDFAGVLGRREEKP